MMRMDLGLYVVTDESLSRGRSHEEIARAAIAGGADAIQLRDKTCGCLTLLRTGRALAAYARETQTLFIVNDRLDVALACGADGVHLGQRDLPVGVARQLSPESFIIGVSVGSVDKAKEAERQGADYVALSPVFTTVSKNDAGPGHGLATLRAIKRSVSIPVIAIGGITRSNVEAVIASGADGVAVISAVALAMDITQATRVLKTIISDCKRSRKI